MRITVTGGGGMIGGHLVSALLDQGHKVRAVDIKPKVKWWQWHDKAENWAQMDCSRYEVAEVSVRGAQHVYNLAEDMGGIGYITENVIACAESIQIGIAVLKAAVRMDVERLFFSSSACVYPTHLQTGNHDFGRWLGLREFDAWPAEPEDGYGFSKLYMEKLCQYYQEAGRLQTRVARYHNVFGSFGSWNDGREKAPAAICRKVAEAKHNETGLIDVWGNGDQLRSYLHVSDCVEGTIALMNSDITEPLNIGSDYSVTVNELIDVVEHEAELFSGELQRLYDPSKPQGVHARNADLTLVREKLGWEPKLTLEEGIAETYRWIEKLVTAPDGA